METVKLIIEASGIIMASKDMTVCYDERGEESGVSVLSHVYCAGSQIHALTFFMHIMPYFQVQNMTSHSSCSAVPPT